MTCPNCHTANPEGAKFCLNCGNPLPLVCSNCGTPVSAGAKFCHNCGYRLAEPAAVGRAVSLPSSAGTSELPPQGQLPSQRAAAQARLEQYIPKELLARLESARTTGGMRGERRIVTILFCDVKGSTAAAENLDPEEWAEIMNGAFDHLIPPVYRYEGTLARLMGDAILAFFGAPIAHEDDPQRAVLAGLDILEGIRPYRERMKRERGLDFDVRIGINTGLVVVGEVGSDLRVEYTAMGDAVNLAARMEQTAEPGTVQISGNTHRQVAPLFELDSLGGIEVKGRSEPVQAYRVLSPKAEPGRLRGIEGLHSPLVGRERELNTLQARVEELRQGRGHIVSVMGEAGLGKSRLMAELREQTADGRRQSAVGSQPTAIGDQPSAVRWLEGRSLSYESSLPYAPFVELLDGFFGLREEETDTQKYQKVASRVAEILPDRSEETAPFIATLMDIKLEGEAAERVTYLEPPQVRGNVFAAVTGFIEALALAAPLVLVMDDLHWVDPTSLELLERLMPLTETSALMLAGVFRPRREEASWRFHETASRDFGHRYTAVSLEPLDEGDSRTLVGNLLHIEDLPERVRKLILAKSEGNPFFVEEVIRSLLDARLVVRNNSHWRATREIESIALPDTLAGVITARLDRLDEHSRRVAQTAAVIGREFPFSTLREVSNGTGGSLDEPLAKLMRRELIREKSRLPQRMYLFKHVLTQETAYASLLLSQRRELHRRVAESLERAAPERVSDIARHFLEARESARALPYLVEAGERAAHAYATPEAIGSFTQALDLLKTIDNLELARRTYEGLGGALTLANEIPRAVETYQAMLELARSHADIPMQVSALNKLSYVVAMRLGQFPDAEQSLADAEQLGREAQDKAGLTETFFVRCMMCTAMADFSGVERYMSEAVTLGRELDARQTMVAGMVHVANSRISMTRYDEAWDAAQEALQLTREIGDRLHESDLLGSVLPLYHLRNGDLDAARKSAEEGRLLADKIGAIFPRVDGAVALGEIARLRGEYERALAELQRARQAALPVESFMPFMAVPPLGSLDLTYMEISEHLADRAAEFRNQALKLLENPVAMMGGAPAWAALGFSSLALGKVDMADELFQQGLNYPTMLMHVEKPRLLIGSSLVALERNQLDDAAQLVEQARVYVEERGMKHLYPLVAFAEGQARAAHGELERALESFARAEAKALEMQMRPMVWQARAGAASVLSAMGREAEAQSKREEARATIEEIAGLFEDQVLQTKFVESAMEKMADSNANSANPTPFRYGDYSE